MFTDDEAEKLAELIETVASDDSTKEAQAKALKKLPWKDIATGAGILGSGALGGGALAHSMGTEDKMKKNITDAAQHASQLQNTLQQNVQQDRAQQRALNKAMLSSAMRDKKLRNALQQMAQGGGGQAGQAAEQSGQPAQNQPQG